jgi:nitrogen PTS system EIIA component
MPVAVMSTEPSLRLVDLLTEERVVVDVDGTAIRSKEDALHVLAQKLAPAVGTDQSTIERLLVDRERLQSTGIGDGVAVPHASADSATRQAIALLVCPVGVSFDSIDGTDVRLIVGVVGPRHATGEHLRVLARISRLLRDAATRSELAASDGPESAYHLVRRHDQDLR